MVELSGDEFPAMPSTTLDPLAPLVILAPSLNRNIPADGRLVWEASTDVRNRIDLTLRIESAGGTSGRRQTVLCRLQDDGEFVVPEAVHNQADWIVRAARTRDTEVAVGDALLRISQISER